MKSRNWNKLTNSPKINKRNIEGNLGKHLSQEDYEQKLNKVKSSALIYNKELITIRKNHKSMFLKSKIKRTIERESLLSTKDFFNIQLVPSVSMFQSLQPTSQSNQNNQK